MLPQKHNKIKELEDSYLSEIWAKLKKDENLTGFKSVLIARAMLKYGEIDPCCKRETLSDSFTIEGGNILFLWFNSDKEYTHIEKGLLPN